MSLSFNTVSNFLSIKRKLSLPMEQNKRQTTQKAI